MRTELARGVVVGSLMVVVVVCGACAAGNPPPPKTTPPASGNEGALKAAGDAKVGDKSKCPVSGEEFTVTASSPKVEHNGKTYYFCCPGCDEKFQKNPSKYLDTK